MVIASAAFDASVVQGANRLPRIPYRGDVPMFNDLLAGQVQSAFVTLSAALPHIQAGKLKAIAIANPARIPAISEVPPTTGRACRL